jgi:transmembrane sensor
MDRQDAATLEAAEWLLRLSEDAVDADDIAQWQQWLSARPDNRAAFERAQTVWDLTSRVKNPAWPTDSEVAADGARFGWLATHRMKLALAAVLVLSVIAGVVSWQWLGSRDTLALVTDLGQNRSFTLPDGSRVSLGGASHIQSRFSEKRRTIELASGEAFFEVEKDPARPFVVRAGEVSVEAVGTAFNVRRAAERIEVVVTSGAVRVNGEQIDAGMRTTIDSGVHIASAATEVAAVLKRQQGQLQYNDEPLRFVVADLNRYSKVPIEILSPQAGELRVTGTVLERDVDAWIEGLSQALPVEVSLRDGRIGIR